MSNKLTTPEFDKLNKDDIILSEYPRPNFKRDSYICLNGYWDYKITKDKNDINDFNKTIRVPYPIEAPASTVERTLKEDEYLIYHTKFKVDKSFIKDTTFIHFLGVDQGFKIILNGVEFDEIFPMYLPSKIDITKALKEDNELIVICKDTLDIIYPYGKQSKKPKGIFYTPVSGIYFPVFLESVNYGYIEDIKLTPTMESLSIDISSASNEFEVEIFEGEELIIKENIPSNKTFHFAKPHLWDVDDPFLYKMIIKTESDKVETYFALRQVELKNGFVHLNNKKIFITAVLDQGYYPEGLYTPSSYESYKNDILTMKELGFNTLRKHIKIELPYFYYLCDKLGMLVMQDFVNNGDYSFLRDTALPTIGWIKRNDYLTHFNKKARKNYIKHYTALQKYLYNFPSIIAYTIFNEGWGQFRADYNYEIAKSNDPTRLYDSTSGWFQQKKSDFNSYHLYFKNINKLPKIKKKPVFISEFGGFAYLEKEHLYSEDSFGYDTFESTDHLYEGLKALLEEKVLPYKNNVSGFVYTQLSDVETEVNGIITYDRKVVKFKKEVKELIEKFK